MATIVSGSLSARWHLVGSTPVEPVYVEWVIGIRQCGYTLPGWLNDLSGPNYYAVDCDLLVQPRVMIDVPGAPYDLVLPAFPAARGHAIWAQPMASIEPWARYGEWAQILHNAVGVTVQ